MSDLLNELIRAYGSVIPNGPHSGYVMCRLCGNSLPDPLRHFREQHPDAYAEINGEPW